MPSTSVYLPEDVLEGIDERKGPDESRSEWITKALRRELEHEHDELEDLERRIQAIEEALVRAAIHDEEPAVYLDLVEGVTGMQRDYIRVEEADEEDDSTESDS